MSGKIKQFGKRFQNLRIPLGYPIGHFYSPIVDPLHVREVEDARAGWPSMPTDSGIELNLERMERLFISFSEKVNSTLDFPRTQTTEYRYYSNNGFFDFGDAFCFAGMILEFRPGKIVEVGSGFSTACALDTLERGKEFATETICIEPYPKRLRSILTSRDLSRVRIIEKPMQFVGPAVFEELAPGDFLFFDSTHVAKTKSDVVIALFEILPRLPSGTFIHFHDIFDRFEYPHEWIFQVNRSWNEAYFLRAFLMDNNKYEVIYFNSHFCNVRPDAVQKYMPRAGVGGGSIWLRKI
jgi:hypothetical protein